MSDYDYKTGYPLTVYRGAQVLDAAHPGWEQNIDLDTLDMASTCKCVIGQLYGNDLTAYERGLRDLGIGGSAAKYGFSAWGRQRWGDLTVWWRELIDERRSAAT